MSKSREGYLIWAIMVFWMSQGLSALASGPGKAPAGVGIDQKLGGQVPLALSFRDEDGRPVTLDDFMADKPIILAPVYFGCPNLCNFTLNSMVESLAQVRFIPAQDYEVIVVSIDPNETPELAKAKKANYVKHFGRRGGDAGFHFLTGDKTNIDHLTQALGFHYRYDPTEKQYYHAASLMVLTPTGKISRYLYGLEFPPKDIRLALIESAQKHIASPVDQFLLLCYHYDPTVGKYGITIMNVLRLSGLASVLLLSGLIVTLSRRPRTQPAGGEHGASAGDQALFEDDSP